jgi:hypothetical protein
VYAWDMCSWKRLLYPLDEASVDSLGIPCSNSVYEDMSISCLCACACACACVVCCARGLECPCV